MQTPEDKQVGFEDWALAQRTGPNEVLEKIAALVDFSEAERRLEATYSELGRPGHRAAVLLRVMLLQHLYGLSDPQAEAQQGVPGRAWLRQRHHEKGRQPHHRHRGRPGPQPAQEPAAAKH